MEIDSTLWKRLLNLMNTNKEGESYVDLILELKKEGWGQENVYDLFNDLLGYAVEHGTEEQDDAIRNTMDRIVGWCSEGYWLFDKYLKT